ncbi:MAG: siphovirus ReqiPepy6 Gp37-like family protein [Oscillospiraceae bacterium]|nr:siphovirus ReqiPepy6 Gp37-like family protein [Oscillospiraceae bacterium]
MNHCNRDIEYYQCGQFEIFIAANPRNLSIFQIGKIIGCDDNKTNFGIIESVSLKTDAENDDYLIVILHPKYKKSV